MYGGMSQHMCIALLKVGPRYVMSPQEIVFVDEELQEERLVASGSPGSYSLLDDLFAGIVHAFSRSLILMVHRSLRCILFQCIYTFGHVPNETLQFATFFRCHPIPS